jgi:hypothetical protein
MFDFDSEAGIGRRAAHTYLRRRMAREGTHSIYTILERFFREEGRVEGRPTRSREMEEDRRRGCEFEDWGLAVVVAGAGHCGPSAAARLK